MVRADLLSLVGGASASSWGSFRQRPWPCSCFGPWYVPSGKETVYWNALVAFLLLVLPAIRRSSRSPGFAFARVGTSVAFIPFISSVLLFARRGRW